MDDCEIIVEDGEITDDSEEEQEEEEQNDIETYKVLERPLEIMNLHRPPVQEIFSEEEFDNSSSDSDSDAGFAKQAKRTKLNKIPLPRANQTKVKKYDIWSRRAQEDAITESLVTCDVSKIDRSLGVESYDYTRSNRYIDNRKRKHDQKSVHLRLGKREDIDDDETKGNSRKILDLIENTESSNENLAKDIANKLMEEKDDLILRIVKAVGKEKSIELFKKTQEIEDDGGMLIMNGTRRRTPGGVYIFLLKRDDHVTKKQQNEIFLEEKQHFKQLKKQREKERLKKHKNKTKNKILGGGEKLKDLPSRIDIALKDNNDTVPNPPPSPASEDSNAIQNTSDRSVNNYSDDFLDLGTGNDMDLF